MRNRFVVDMRRFRSFLEHERVVAKCREKAEEDLRTINRSTYAVYGPLEFQKMFDSHPRLYFQIEGIETP